MSTTISKSKAARTQPKPTSGRLFFLDLGSGRMLSANPDGSDLKTIVTEGRRLPDGVVVDVAAGHIYWTNMGNPSANDGSIERADLDGKNVTTIVPEGGTFTPSSFNSTRQRQALLVAIAKACASCARIWTAPISKRSWKPAMAKLTGKRPRNWCVGIALDVPGGKFYWTQKGNDNAGQGRIFRANLEIPKGQSPANRKDIEVLFDGLPEPIDLDLDLTNRMMYWTDRGDPPRGNTVNRAPMDSPRESPRPGDCFHPPDGRNWPGAGLKGGRMFVTDFGGSIYSANLDGSNRKTLLFAQGNLTGIAYAEFPASL